MLLPQHRGRRCRPPGMSRRRSGRRGRKRGSGTGSSGWWLRWLVSRSNSSRVLAAAHRSRSMSWRPQHSRKRKTAATRLRLGRRGSSHCVPVSICYSCCLPCIDTPLSHRLQGNHAIMPCLCCALGLVVQGSCIRILIGIHIPHSLVSTWMWPTSTFGTNPTEGAGARSMRCGMTDCRTTYLICQAAALVERAACCPGFWLAAPSSYGIGFCAAMRLVCF